MKNYIIPIHSQEEYQKVFLELKYLFKLYNKTVIYRIDLNCSSVTLDFNKNNYIFFYKTSKNLILDVYVGQKLENIPHKSNIILDKDYINSIQKFFN